MNLRVLNLLEKVLDQKALTDNKGNAAFWCPKCKKDFNKKKLVVFLDDDSDKFGWWQCHVCKETNNMSGRNLFKLLKNVNAKNTYYYELSKIVKNINKNFSFVFNEEQKQQNAITLPEEFISLIDDKNNLAYEYIAKRGILDSDIIKYNIGYCKDGTYKNRIIIPSYDFLGNLNYFIARSYDETWLPKYKNPKFEHKNFSIIFELYINWKMPILIVEGVFDAIAARRNAIPLLGQSIGLGLKSKLLEKDVDDIIIALDNDAIKTSMKYVEKFISEGINVRFINLNGKDPSEIGFEKFISSYNKSTNIDFENLIKLKMESMWN